MLPIREHKIYKAIINRTNGRNGRNYSREHKHPTVRMDILSKQKINTETSSLKYALDQLDIIDIYRAFHPKTSDYIFFSSSHKTFLRIDYVLGCKTTLNKFKKIIPTIFSQLNALKQYINLSLIHI